MSERVIIFDTTLRDGEQALSASLSLEHKLRIARQLERLGVDVIEAGFPVSSPEDFRSVKAIADTVTDSTVCGLSRAVKADIEACGAALKNAERSRIHTFVGTSPIHIHKKLRKTESAVIDLAREHVRFARNLCDEVEFSAEDACRTEPDFLCRIVEEAILAGATTINIPDTVGYVVPELYAQMVDDLMNRVPNIDQAVLSVHCHNDLGMATANSITAVKHGARQIECAMNGIGERAGNCALEEVVMTLATRQDYLPYECGVVTEEIMRTSKLVRDLCSMPVQPNKAVVGSSAFSHSSGIHQDGILKAQNTYEIMTPQSVGLKENVMNLTSRSGKHMVKNRLIELGYREDEFDIAEFYTRFIDLADKKGTVYNDDLIVLMELDGENVADVWHLDYYNISSGQVPTATIVLTDDAGHKHQEAAVGDGAVDAATKAINRIVRYDIAVMDFHLEAVTKGSEAIGKVRIDGTYDEQAYVGNGTSTDIVEASLRAYLDLVNKVARIIKVGRGNSPAGYSGQE
ncbi:2-isopropylmalate synthase [Chitinivibrio alkaliphilus]|uniref:2-isopropylmalate synthase n=1 Tax=Chitinivibrio alkaliphilus ACht1 TaxID=1313304 RepID=U7D7V2_9BACT|nr:2-isopropylmalate synthase [Chitinivibrio alkaliphilus]ERP31651.1 2-isopropylmalate synthase [Chitinivibrio alkaliphilus ACht1]